MSERRKVVALLPIKGNSERVKGKNFRLLGGKPLFMWILDSLLAIAEIDEVVINTDVPDKFSLLGTDAIPRVRVRERRPEICGDFVSMNLVLRDDIENVPADIYLMTHATNPLLGSDTIRRGINTFRSGSDEGRCDSLFAATRHQTRFYTSAGNPINHDPDNLIRTQDLEPWFEENSCLYVFTRQSFEATGARIGRAPLILETPKLESVDIDEEQDWQLAEALVTMQLREGPK